MVTPHSLRRTYASLRYACGDDPVYVAEQGGWKDPTFPIRVYARAVKGGRGCPEQSERYRPGIYQEGSGTQ